MPKINKHIPASPFEIRRDFYCMQSTGDDAEVTLYGQIVEERPTDWYGKPVDGDYIVQSEFLADLERIRGSRNITLRINSLGGDAAVAVLIHNRIREMAAQGANVSCIVDGVAMSGGSLIMCACDHVRINPSSLVMIHKCWSILFGGYNADELRQEAEHRDAYDKAQASIYARKSGLSETQILHMMAETTYMTGKEAVEKGFADELIEDAKPLGIAASADGRTLYVKGVEFHLAPGMFAPDSVPTAENPPVDPGEGEKTVTPDASGSNPAAPVNIPNQPGEPGDNEGGVHTMTLEELRVQHPEIVAQIEEAARADERRRLSEIDDIAATIGNAEMVHEARYGQTACDARELAYRAAQASAKRGQSFLAAAADDAKNANVNAVPAAPAPIEEPRSMSAQEKADAAIAATLGKEDK